MKVDNATRNSDVSLSSNSSVSSNVARSKPGTLGDTYDASSKNPSISSDGTVVLPDESHASIDDMQQQIQFLQNSIDASKPDADQKIWAAQQQIMVAEQTAMATGLTGASSSGAATATSLTPATTSSATQSVDSNTAQPAASTASSAGTSTTSQSTDSSASSSDATSGNYQGDALTATSGPGVQGLFGKKAYGPNTPQGAQAADPYPYIGKQYSGPASNFPSASQWMDFDSLFEKAIPVMKAHGDTDDQIAMIKKGIEASGSLLDKRVTLCVMMKESGGALNASTTYSASGGANPGLFQSDGGSTYNPADPQGSIDKMISDGIQGTAPDKTSIIHALQVTGGNIYEALRGYNSGLWGGIGNLDNLSYRPQGAGDTAYVSNFANLITTGDFV